MPMYMEGSFTEFTANAQLKILAIVSTIAFSYCWLSGSAISRKLIEDILEFFKHNAEAQNSLEYLQVIDDLAQLCVLSGDLNGAKELYEMLFRIAENYAFDQTHCIR